MKKTWWKLHPWIEMRDTSRWITLAPSELSTNFYVCVHGSETYTASQDGTWFGCFYISLSSVTADHGTFYWHLLSQFLRDDWNSFDCQYATCQTKQVTYWEELDIIVIIVFLILMVGVFRGWNCLPRCYHQRDSISYHIADSRIVEKTAWCWTPHCWIYNTFSTYTYIFATSQDLQILIVAWILLYLISNEWQKMCRSGIGAHYQSNGHSSVGNGCQELEPILPTLLPRDRVSEKLSSPSCSCSSSI